MHIDYFQRHLAVASREEAARMLRTDRKFWNVISICSPTTPPLALNDALQWHRLRFEDTERRDDPEAVRPPRAGDLVAAFEFADSTSPAPLLVHCQMGLSRSAAVALVLLARKLWPAEEALTKAIDTLLLIRPQCRPNLLITKIGFEVFMPASEAMRFIQTIVDNPHFAANRFPHRS